ncbi:MAG: hypothetical protein LBF68_01810 [Christensenellaceae bacterium]|nr:hypothetical protein [Christensenellaceae bacterium]
MKYTISKMPDYSTLLIEVFLEGDELRAILYRTSDPESGEQLHSLMRQSRPKMFGVKYKKNLLQKYSKIICDFAFKTQVAKFLKKIFNEEIVVEGFDPKSVIKIDKNTYKDFALYEIKDIQHNKIVYEAYVDYEYLFEKFDFPSDYNDIILNYQKDNDSLLYRKANLEIEQYYYKKAYELALGVVNGQKNSLHENDAVIDDSHYVTILLYFEDMNGTILIKRDLSSISSHKVTTKSLNLPASIVKAIKGMKINEKKKIECRLTPEDIRLFQLDRKYYIKDYIGQNVKLIANIYIESIEKVNFPIIDNAFIKEKTKFNSIEKYRNAYIEILKLCGDICDYVPDVIQQIEIITANMKNKIDSYYADTMRDFDSADNEFKSGIIGFKKVTSLVDIEFKMAIMNLYNNSIAALANDRRVVKVLNTIFLDNDSYISDLQCYIEYVINNCCNSLKSIFLDYGIQREDILYIRDLIEKILNIYRRELDKNSIMVSNVVDNTYVIANRYNRHRYRIKTYHNEDLNALIKELISKLPREIPFKNRHMIITGDDEYKIPIYETEIRNYLYHIDRENNNATKRMRK